MKPITLLFIFFSLLITDIKAQSVEVYILFNIESVEKCKVEFEGEGYKYVNKYRKESKGNYIDFLVCDEKFRFNKILNKKKVFKFENLNELKFSSLNDLKKRKKENILKSNPYSKIYIYQKTKTSKVIRYEVKWIDDWSIVD